MLLCSAVFFSQRLAKPHVQRSIRTVKKCQWTAMMIAARETSKQITLYKHSITTRLYNATCLEYSHISSDCMLYNVIYIYTAFSNSSSSFSYLPVFLHVLLQQGAWWRFSCCASWPRSCPHWERCKLHQEECTVGRKTACELRSPPLPGQLCQLHSCLIISFILYYLQKKKRGRTSKQRLCNILAKVMLSCVSGCNLCLHQGSSNLY